MTDAPELLEHLMLVVDDDKEYRTRLRRLGESHHAEVIAVGSQTEAEEVLRTRKPCTHWLDVGLLHRPDDSVVLAPDLPLPPELARLGFLVAKYARGRDWAQGLEFPFIVVMTGQRDQESYAYSNDAYQHGANYFIPKPIWNPKREQENPHVLVAEGFARCRKRFPDGCPGLAPDTDDRPRLLHLVGTKRGQGHLVVVDKDERAPGAAGFRILYRAHLVREAGRSWIHARHLYREGANHSQALIRLEQALGSMAGILERQVPEQGRETGRVRLVVPRVEVARSSIENEPALRDLLLEHAPLDDDE